MLAVIRPALMLFIMLTLVTGFAYPFLTTGIGQWLFSYEANGSLIHDNENKNVVGSALIGQEFTAPQYFWGRPSATGHSAYNATASGGSNLGPLNPALKEAVAHRVKALRDADPDNQAAVPVDLVTTSASGLDPHISPAAAAFQLPRVARLRGMGIEQLQSLVEQNTGQRQWGIFGEPRVNVLLLNLALDELATRKE